MRGYVPIYVGLGLVCLAVMPFLGFAPTAVDGLAIAAVALFVAAAFSWSRSRRDPYDLRLLQEVHERELAQAIEPEVPEQYDSVLCPHCHNVYSAKLPACPRCGRTPAA